MVLITQTRAHRARAGLGLLVLAALAVLLPLAGCGGWRNNITDNYWSGNEGKQDSAGYYWPRFAQEDVAEIPLALDAQADLLWSGRALYARLTTAENVEQIELAVTRTDNTGKLHQTTVTWTPPGQKISAKKLLDPENRTWQPLKGPEFRHRASQAADVQRGQVVFRLPFSAVGVQGMPEDRLWVVIWVNRKTLAKEPVRLFIDRNAGVMDSSGECPYCTD